MNITNIKPDPNTYGIGFCGKCQDGKFFTGFSSPLNHDNIDDIAAWHEFLEWFEKEYPEYALQSIWKCFFKDFDAIVSRSK